MKKDLEKDVFKIFYLKDNSWILFDTNSEITAVAIIVDRLTKIRPDKMIKIEKNEKVLVMLNGSEYQSWYFRNRYCREKGKSYDYISSYAKQLEKQKNR